MQLAVVLHIAGCRARLVAGLAVVHGSTLEDAVLVGMGAILLNRTHVGTGSIIGAGAVCTEGTIIPPHSLVLGIPARVVTTLGPDAKLNTQDNARRYALLKERHRSNAVPRHRMSKEK